MYFSKNDLQDVLDLALKNGGDFADIFLEDKEIKTVFGENNVIERVRSGRQTGAGVRVVSGESTAYAYTNKMTKEGLEEAARVVSKVVSKNKKVVSKNKEERIIRLLKKNPEFQFDFKKRPDEISLDEKVELVKRTNQAARNVSQKIKQVSVSYGDVIQKVIIANSDGVYVEDERIRVRLAVNAIAGEGDTIQTGFEVAGAVSGLEILDGDLPEQMAEKAAGRAVQMLTAKPAPAGNMDVVMAGEAGGTMVHEACGHGLEADLVQKGLSVYSNRKGEIVASEEITVIDDATKPGKYGSLVFDDEGTKGQKTVLIKDGELLDYMYDWFTAYKDKRPSTGNGRRESFEYKPIPRMTNTYIAPGKDDPEKIVKEVKEGLLVKKMGGGQVNTVNGDFVFDVAEGYLIKDGEIVSPVRGATLTGNGPEALKNVVMVGKDLGFTIGTCGKNGQGVPVSDAQPTILIKGLIVGGISQDEENDFQIKKIKRI
ncbi:MAG TPA: TldD/PmbA family protein [Clostridia bacterium]|nr:TldD/PmbA family protein [Clostridia bacterium]